MIAGCCALGTCEDPGCDLCQRVAKLAQPAYFKETASKRAHSVPVAKKKAAKHPMFKKRHRVGPHR